MEDTPLNFSNQQTYMASGRQDVNQQLADAGLVTSTVISNYNLSPDAVFFSTYVTRTYNPMTGSSLIYESTSSMMILCYEAAQAVNLEDGLYNNSGGNDLECTKTSDMCQNDHTSMATKQAECSSNKTFKCLTCGRLFKKAQYLKVHARLHTGERPFKCSICDKGFTRMTTLKKHKKIHGGFKPFKCDFCQKSFVLMSVLKIHMRIHTRQKPFECSICGNGFTRKVNLKRHERTQHRQ